MKKLLPLLCAVMMALLSSCSSETFIDKYASGVVMTVSEFSQTINIGETTLYVTIDDDHKITFYDAPVSYQCFGTGFFVGKNGQIATNAHNVNPWWEYNTDSVKNVIRSVFSQKKVEILNAIELNDKQIAVLDGKKTHYQDGDMNQAEAIAAINEINYNIDNYKKKNEKGQRAIIRLDSLLQLPISFGHTTSIGVVFNGDVIDTTSILDECDIRWVDNFHDLALIQLEDEETPKECVVFEIEEATEDNGVVKEGDKVYMIGFNAGPVIGNTKDGFKAQMTQGNVSQLKDDTEFLHSIPIIQGSSGSPILNKDGKVIGINHATIVGTQSFNYGIFSTWLKKILKLHGLRNN